MLLAKRTLRRLFDLGVVIKGIDGALEVAGGVLFLVIDPQTLGTLILSLTAHEISEDPSDLVANLVRHGLGHLSANTSVFAGVYLLGHGLVKLFLMVFLLRGKLWAYLAALWFLGAFIPYQVYRIVLTNSLGLIALTGFDVVVMALIWHEYRFRMKEPGTSVTR
jgi:uncharacterized membrane protein